MKTHACLARPAQRQHAGSRPARPPGRDSARRPGVDASPRLTAQRRAIESAFGGVVQERAHPAAANAPVQRRLVTHAKKDDEGTDYVPAQTAGFIHSYMALLAEDSSVLVDGEPGGLPGLTRVVKAGEIDGGAVREQLTSSLLASSAWKHVANAATRKNLAAHVLEASGMAEHITLGTDDEVSDYIDNDAGEYQDEVQSWIDGRLAGLDKAQTVGAIPADIPVEWHADLAQIVYDATKTHYYGIEAVAGQPYTPPFKKLIADINADAIGKLSYVRRYGSPGKRGAEFVVDAPADKKDDYEGKAVLHTHYPDDDSPPNYAHTKPEAKKYELGFGYTVVSTNKVTAMDDTRNSWNDLA